MVSEATTSSDPSVAGVLAAARRLRVEALTAEAKLLAQVLRWARLHEVEDVDDAATWGDTPVPLAGAGALLVSDFCVVELAATLGLSPAAGRQLMADVVELGCRLPRTWARVGSGQLAPWRARSIARQTTVLSAEGAAFVDAQIAPFAHKISAAQTERLVDQAIARFDPALAAQQRETAAEGRHFTVDSEQVSFAGTCRVEGELDLPDAYDLDAAVGAGAEQLKALGSTESLDVRRAKAAGELARTQLALGFSAESESAAPGKGPDPAPTAAPRRRRQATLYLHLSDSAGQLENRGPHPVTAKTIREWLGVPGTTVTVRPVLDLNATRTADTYAIPDLLREHVVVRDRTCVFPWCTRPARSCDLDHVIAYNTGGPTSSANLAPLCRRHHRAKTFAGWTYQVLTPGTYEWHGPHGHTWLRDQHGTTDLTPVSAPAPDQ